MPLARQPSDRRRVPRATCTSTAATPPTARSPAPTARCSATTRSRDRWKPPAPSPTARAAHADRGDRRAPLYAAGGATSGVAALARDLRLRARGAGARGPELPAAGAQPHDGRGERRALLRAGRARHARTSPTAARYDPRRRRLGGGCRRCTRRAAASPRRACSDGRDRRLRRRAAGAGRDHDRGGRAVRPAQRPLELAARHAHAAPRARRRRARPARVRHRGRAARRASRSRDDRIPGRARGYPARLAPDQGRHPDPRASRSSRWRSSRSTASSTSCSSTALWGLGAIGNERVIEVRRDPVRDHAPGQGVRRSAGQHRLRGPARRDRHGPPTRRHGGSRSSPRCSCTAACCTSPATCCSSGSSGTTSRTR